MFIRSSWPPARLAPPYLAGRAIDDGIRAQDTGALTVIVIVFLAAAIINWAGDVRADLPHQLGRPAGAPGLRVEVFEHLQRLSVGFPRNKGAISRLTNDVQALDQLVTEGTSTLFSATLTLVGTAVILILMDAELAMITFLTFPVLLVASVAFRLASAGAYALTRVKIAHVTAYFRRPCPACVAPRRAPRHRHRFAELNDEHREANMKTVYLNAAYFPAVELLSAVATAAILLYGNQVVSGDGVTIGVLAAFAHLQSFFDPIQSLSQLYTTYQVAAWPRSTRFELLDEDLDIDDFDAIELSRVRGEIRFEDVTFSYGGEAPRSTTWTSWCRRARRSRWWEPPAPASRRSAFVARFYDPNEGRVLVDGYDLRDVTERSLRSCSGSCRRRASCSRARSGTTSRSAERTRPTRTWRPPRVRLGRTSSSSGCPRISHRGRRARRTPGSAGQRQLVARSRAPPPPTRAS